MRPAFPRRECWRTSAMVPKAAICPGMRPTAGVVGAMFRTRSNNAVSRLFKGPAENRLCDIIT
jgi:hypothetical protein